MFKYCRSFMVAMAGALMAIAAFASELFFIAVARVNPEFTPQKLDAQLAQNVANKVYDAGKPVSVGVKSDNHTLGFVSMLKAINSRSFTANA